jgi:hypothetical protein
MNAKNPVLWISLFTVALFPGLSVTRAQTAAETDAVRAISNLENEGVKADLAATRTFTRKFWLRIGPGAIAMEPISQKPNSWD